jgi:hypothetical protein
MFISQGFHCCHELRDGKGAKRVPMPFYPSGTGQEGAAFSRTNRNNSIFWLCLGGAKREACKKALWGNPVEETGVPKKIHFLSRLAGAEDAIQQQAVCKTGRLRKAKR